MSKLQKKQPKCAYLNPDGIQCTNRAGNKTIYHGDAELYSHGADCAFYVIVYFCGKHYKGTKEYPLVNLTQ